MLSFKLKKQVAKYFLCLYILQHEKQSAFLSLTASAELVTVITVSACLSFELGPCRSALTETNLPQFRDNSHVLDIYIRH